MIDGYDYSSGCVHQDYSNTGYVSGPSGSFQQTFSGLSAYFNVPAYFGGSYYFSNEALVNCSCFGTGLSAGGGFGSQTVNHPIPTGEVTQSGGFWNSVYPTLHAFYGVLQSNVGASFAGRQVTERDPGGGVDSCWYPGSNVPYSNTITGGSWSITSSNSYNGYDSVGWLPYAVSSYRAAGKAPCQAVIPQRMDINRPGAGDATYKTNQLRWIINATTVGSERDGNLQTRTWP
jgi:hypothetical protein